MSGCVSRLVSTGTETVAAAARRRGATTGSFYPNCAHVRYPDPMRFEELARRLDAAAVRELPGPEAQALLAPRPRRAWIPGRLPADATPAAGLALLYPRDDDAVLL